MRYMTKVASDVTAAVFVRYASVLLSNAISIEAERLTAHPGHFDNPTD